MSPDRHVIGMLLGRDDTVTHWSFDMRPGDVIFDHAGASTDGYYRGGAKFSMISLTPDDLSEFLIGEPVMADLAFWQRRTHVRPNAALGPAIADRFTTMVGELDQHAAALSPAGSEFWMRALVETFVGAIAGGIPTDGNHGPVTSALIVRKVDEFLREHRSGPVHISELCQEFQISRRTLHRAFDETLGIGPITYLRRRRLNDVRRALVRGDAGSRSIAEIAINFGFDEVGRFAGYYRQLFGELPSQTVRRNFPTKR